MTPPNNLAGLLHCSGDGKLSFKKLKSFQIGEDDKTLPGVEGKIVVWVEEE